MVHMVSYDMVAGRLSREKMFSKRWVRCSMVRCSMFFVVVSGGMSSVGDRR